jgi:hypothetical protein
LGKFLIIHISSITQHMNTMLQMMKRGKGKCTWGKLRQLTPHS